MIKDIFEIALSFLRFRNVQNISKTRKHSSGMRTTHFSDWRGVSLQRRSSGQRPPTPFWTETHPLDRYPPPGTWTRDRDPPKGTWDEVARQEVTSYRDATVHIIRRLNQMQNELKIKSAFVTSDTATSCIYLWQIEILRKT